MNPKQEDIESHFLAHSFKVKPSLKKFYEWWDGLFAEKDPAAAAAAAIPSGVKIKATADAIAESIPATIDKANRP
mgnify:CR=1 FL=1